MENGEQPWADRMNLRIQRVRGTLYLVAIVVLLADIIWTRLQTGSWWGTVDRWVAAVAAIVFLTAICLSFVTRDRLKRWEERHA